MTKDEKRLTIRLSGKLKEQVAAAASALELTPSAYVRLAVLAKLKEDAK